MGVPLIPHPEHSRTPPRNCKVLPFHCVFTRSSGNNASMSRKARSLARCRSLGCWILKCSARPGAVDRAVFGQPRAHSRHRPRAPHSQRPRGSRKTRRRLATSWRTRVTSDKPNGLTPPYRPWPMTTNRNSVNQLGMSNPRPIKFKCTAACAETSSYA